MKHYKHKDFPELGAEIHHEWHQEHKSNNFIVTFGRRVIFSGLPDHFIQQSSNWVLVSDTEPEDLSARVDSIKKLYGVLDEEGQAQVRKILNF